MATITSYHVDVDWTDEGRKDRTFIEDLDAMRVKHPAVTYEIINPGGPAGGWPVVRMSSQYQTALRAAFYSYNWGAKGVTINDFLERVQTTTTTT